MENLNSIVQLAPYVVALPFVAALLIILGARFSKTLSMLLSIGAVAVGFAYSLALFYVLTKQPALAPWYVNWDWFVCNNFKLAIGVLVDNLMVIMMIIVTSISLLVQIYTHGYMREDPGYSRFYAYLSLFTGSMLGLVIATNLFETYFFWELVAVSSYLLIGFWWYKTSAAEACLKAFVVNRIGDFGFLIGILLLLAATKDCWGTGPVLSFVGTGGHDLAGAILSAHTAHTLSASWLTVIAIFTFAGPVAKSAQFPLHVWLPDAMEGPTPISALIHAATMVAAGVYLVARAYPIWLTPEGHTGSVALAVVAGIGGFTAFMAATIALSQFDIKRILAWSTVSQLGYMFVGLGAGAYSGGLFHLFNHAFFKAMLFLCSGAVIHGLGGEQDIRNMGGLKAKDKMPITAFCFLIGALSISGFPGLSGFFSKDDIIASAVKLNVWLGALMILTALLTAFYMFRVYFLTFEGDYRGKAHVHEAPPVMWLPLVALAIPSVISGYLGFNFQSLSGFSLTNTTGPSFPSQFASFVHFGPKAEFEGVNGLVMVVSVVAAILGIFAAWAIYAAKTWHLNREIVESKNPILAWAYQFSFHKWRFDDWYLAFVQRLVLPVFEVVWRWIDKYIVDSLVDLTAVAALCTGEFLKYTENGRAQYYALIIFAWVAGLTIIAYFFRP